MSYAHEVATTILKQIKAIAGFNYYSWGVSKNLSVDSMQLSIDDKKSNYVGLLMKVNGYIHSGYVFVAYNEAMDLYDIFILKNPRNGNYKSIKFLKGIYCEDLFEVIDRQVETK